MSPRWSIVVKFFHVPCKMFALCKHSIIPSDVVHPKLKLKM
jgi:hypothetical protein